MEPTVVMTSESINELAKTMIKVQGALAPARRDAENTFTSSRYATLQSVMETCQGVLLANGIWMTQFPVPAEAGHLGLVTKLVHAESGQWQASLLVMPLPKCDPQGYGSAMTYARRYGLAALVGIVTENDDDAEWACGRPASTKSTSAPARHGTSDSVSASKMPPHGHGAGSSHQPTPPPSIQPSPPPRLDGVRYRSSTAHDGRPCLIATGNTQPKRELLRNAGFQWDAARKHWWRYADAA